MTQTWLPTHVHSHGGDPWPWLKTERGYMCDQLERFLHGVRRELGQAPRAVLMVSGHWAAYRFLRSSFVHPPMACDYGGPPEHACHIRCGAPGEPTLAETIRVTLERGSVRSALDPQRGFDHGTFTVMYPDADVSLLQLSINANCDLVEHLRVGDLITPLRGQGILIIGSGFSCHNTQSMRSGAGGAASVAFDRWLNDTLVGFPPDVRRRQLSRREDAPAARAAHPQEDHLVPLMVVGDAACNDMATRIHHQTDFMGAINVASLRFGAAAVRAATETPQEPFGVSANASTSPPVPDSDRRSDFH